MIPKMISGCHDDYTGGVKDENRILKSPAVAGEMK
jgi:hypothetical protein